MVPRPLMFPFVTQDEVWDTSSAFFNHAARRGPVHTTSQNTTHETTSADTPVNRHEHNTQTNQEDRQRTEQLEKDHVIEQSRQLAGNVHSMFATSGG